MSFQESRRLRQEKAAETGTRVATVPVRCLRRTVIPPRRREPGVVVGTLWPRIVKESGATVD